MHEPAAGGETLWQPAHDANADRTGSGLEGRQRGAVTLRSPSTRARSDDGASRWLPTCSPEFFSQGRSACGGKNSGPEIQRRQRPPLPPQTLGTGPRGPLLSAGSLVARSPARSPRGKAGRTRPARGAQARGLPYCAKDNRAVPIDSSRF